MCVYLWSLDLSVFTCHFQEEEEEENDALVQEVEKTNKEEEETNCTHAIPQ